MKITGVCSATIAILGLITVMNRPAPALGQEAQQSAAPAKEAAGHQADSANLLANASVENGSGTAPDGWIVGKPVDGVTCTWDASIGYESKHSLCLTKSVNRYFPIAEWKQTIPIKDQVKHMTVSAYVRAKDLGKAVLDVQFIDAGGKLLGHHWAAYVGPLTSADPMLNHNWKRYSGSVDIPEGTAQISVAAQIYGPGTVWFDDLSAIAAP